MKPKVVITHKIHDSVLDELAQDCELVTNQSGATLPQRKWLRALQTLMR